MTIILSLDDDNVGDDDSLFDLIFFSFVGVVFLLQLELFAVLEDESLLSFSLSFLLLSLSLLLFLGDFKISFIVSGGIPYCIFPTLV